MRCAARIHGMYNSSSYLVLVFSYSDAMCTVEPVEDEKTRTKRRGRLALFAARRSCQRQDERRTRKTED